MRGVLVVASLLVAGCYHTPVTCEQSWHARAAGDYRKHPLSQDSLDWLQNTCTKWCQGGAGDQEANCREAAELTAEMGGSVEVQRPYYETGCPGTVPESYPDVPSCRWLIEHPVKPLTPEELAAKEAREKADEEETQRRIAAYEEEQARKERENEEWNRYQEEHRGGGSTGSTGSTKPVYWKGSRNLSTKDTWDEYLPELTYGKYYRIACFSDKKDGISAGIVVGGTYHVLELAGQVDGGGEYRWQYDIEEYRGEELELLVSTITSPAVWCEASVAPN